MNRQKVAIIDEEEEEEQGQHCTSACLYAHKIKCVCGCGGMNHGIKSMVKIDAFFEKEKEEEEIDIIVVPN